MHVVVLGCLSNTCAYASKNNYGVGGQKHDYVLFNSYSMAKGYNYTTF